MVWMLALYKEFYWLCQAFLCPFFSSHDDDHIYRESSFYSHKEDKVLESVKWNGLCLLLFLFSFTMVRLMLYAVENT